MLHLEHLALQLVGALDHLVVLRDLFLQLLDAVVGQVGGDQDAAERARQRAQQAHACNDYFNWHRSVGRFYPPRSPPYRLRSFFDVSDVDVVLVHIQTSFPAFWPVRI